MSTDADFNALIRRVRAGDAEAAAELVRAYEPEVRRAVRAWLTDPRLGRLLDSTDICQSVLANFFVRAAAGQFEFERPEQLLHLLVRMARNKLRDQARRQHARRRDQRRLGGGPPEALEAVPDGQASPSQIVAGEELLGEFRRRLSEQERYLAEQRALGRGWAEIAAALGSTPAAVRMQLTRAVNRVARELRLEEVGDA